jgi:hypothetical protein
MPFKAKRLRSVRNRTEGFEEMYERLRADKLEQTLFENRIWRLVCLALVAVIAMRH